MLNLLLAVTRKGIEAMDLQALGITKDEVMNLVVTKIVSEIWDAEGDVIGSVQSALERQIDKAVRDSIGDGLIAKIDAVLATEMEKVLHEVVTPRNIWGEKQGEPTTIRAALSERARQFWDLKIDDKGRPSEYGGRPRHEYLMKQLLAEEFNSAVKQNATAIVAAFKEAMKADSVRLLNEHIDKLITVKTR